MNLSSLHEIEIDFSALVSFRQLLHSQPELSGQEVNTAMAVEYFLQSTAPNQVIRQLGGNGLAFIYDSGQPGPRISFRCELDALPIRETNHWAHRSTNEGVSHKCGHDGHMSIMAGLGLWLQQNPPPRGQVMLLFQPAEETGEGAAAVVADKRWESIKPDWLFGLHNVPGYPEGLILQKEGSFCAGSKGVLVKLEGISSHAAEPEKGINPSQALAGIMIELQTLAGRENLWKQKVLLTTVYASLGEKAFGTSAGNAEFGATLRAYNQEDLRNLSRLTEEIIEKHSKKHRLNHQLSYHETFPPTENDQQANAYVRNAARKAGLRQEELKEPFRWSEDFSWYQNSCRTAFFGLGAGENQSPLHHPDYDFPDTIISPGLQLFSQIIEELLFQEPGT